MDLEWFHRGSFVDLEWIGAVGDPQSDHYTCTVGRIKGNAGERPPTYRQLHRRTRKGLRVIGPLSLFWSLVIRWRSIACRPVGDRRTLRSGSWRKARRDHLKAHPRCVICGTTRSVIVHHVVPFAVDPSRLCDPSNLITLCDRGGKDRGCHLMFGHLGSFSTWNVDLHVPR